MVSNVDESDPARPVRSLAVATINAIRTSASLKVHTEQHQKQAQMPGDGTQSEIDQVGRLVTLCFEIAVFASCSTKDDTMILT